MPYSSSLSTTALVLAASERWMGMPPKETAAALMTSFAKGDAIP